MYISILMCIYRTLRQPPGGRLGQTEELAPQRRGCAAWSGLLPAPNRCPCIAHARARTSYLWRLMDQHFEIFHQVYDERFQAKYGFWRPVVDRSVTAFLKCGDLEEGFARVRCVRLPSRNVRGLFLQAARPSLRDGARVSLLSPETHVADLAACGPRSQCSRRPPASRADDSQTAEAAHAWGIGACWGNCLTARGPASWRKSDASWVADGHRREALVGSATVPASCLAWSPPSVTHGELLHWHPHLHMLLTCGAFTPMGDFVELPELDLDRLEAAWQEAVFALYLAPFSLGRGQDRTGSGREDAQLGAQRPEC